MSRRTDQPTRPTVFFRKDTFYIVNTYASAHPKAAMHDIATLFGINQGRVSEILFGKRGE